MFTEYLENIYTKYGDKSLSYFEHNLEVIRNTRISDVCINVYRLLNRHGDNCGVF